VKRSIHDAIRTNLADRILLNDMKKDDFEFVSHSLGHQYMEKTTDEPAFPVNGKIFSNSNGRRRVCLTVQRRKDTKIWIPFVINSGSPDIILSEDAFSALSANSDDEFYDDKQMKMMTVNIHGFDTISVYHTSDTRLKDVNVLGWSFFREMKVFEFVDPTDNTLKLFKNVDQFMEQIRQKK